MDLQQSECLRRQREVPTDRELSGPSEGHSNTDFCRRRFQMHVANENVHQDFGDCDTEEVVVGQIDTILQAKHCRNLMKTHPTK